MVCDVPVPPWRVLPAVWQVACFTTAVGLLLIGSREPSMGMALHNWPTRSTAFVRAYGLTGNVYHTFTFGGYVVYWLQNYKIFGDTRQYCFKHLDDIYTEAHLNPEALHLILNTYQIQTLISKIPDTMPLPSGNFVDAHARFLGSDWACVFFDHVSQVMVKRIPEHARVIRNHEYRVLKPAFPPDFHVRVLLGRAQGDPNRLELELQRCLQEPVVEMYCTLVDVLRRSLTMEPQEIARWLAFFTHIHPQVLKNERVVTRQYVESTKLFLLSLLPSGT